MSFSFGNIGEAAFIRPPAPTITPELIDRSRGMTLAEVATGLTQDLNKQRGFMAELVGRAMEGEFGLDDGDCIVPQGAGCAILEHPEAVTA